MEESVARSVPSQEMEPSGSVTSRAAATRHEADVYTWVQEQVALLRAGRVDALDLENIAEELSDVGLSEYYRLQSAIEIVLLHMLKWDHQSERRTRSWALSIAEHRERARIQQRKSPGLESSLGEIRSDAYRLARLGAARQMKRPLKSLPDECPYTWDEILTRPFDFDADR